MTSRNSRGVSVPLVLLAFLLSACHHAPAQAVRPAAVPTVASRAVADLQRDINTILAAPALDRSYWGILVRSLKTDDPLFALNAGKLMIPGSDMKVVTLAAAAERLGWNYTYETQLAAAGAIDGGVLNGDLVVVGSGDPSIVERDGMAGRLFDSWAETLRSSGVRVVNGRIVGDDNTFDDEGLGAGWMWEDLANGFATPVGALQFNENSARLTVTPGASVSAAPTLALTPAGTGLSIRNLLTTTAATSTATFQARRSPGSTVLELRGTVPLGAGVSAHTVSVDNPTLFFVSALRDALAARGIDVRGPAVDIDDISDPPARDRLTPLVTYRSAPLSALATTMMKLSQNLYAETLLKTVGAAAGTPTFEAGRATTRAALEAWGVAPAALLQFDGSGQSRYNYVTPEALVTILTHVDRDDRLRSPYESSLPVAGRDGTLANRMKGTAAEGNARAKTGTLANVRGMAGYVTTADGEPLVFCVLANNFDATPDTVTRASDAIVARLAQFRR